MTGILQKKACAAVFFCKFKFLKVALKVFFFCTSHLKCGSLYVRCVFGGSCVHVNSLMVYV